MTIVVANSFDQARIQLREFAPAELPGAIVVNTDRPNLGRLVGMMPRPQEIILTEGWQFGRHADDVERALNRCLAKRGGHLDEARFIFEGKLQ